MARLRTAPVEQVVAELLSGLLNAAQVKLGRRDARLLIDMSAGMIEHVRRHVPAELAKQVDDVLGQLRLAQVRAEGATQGKPEPNDLAEVPAPPADAGGQPAQPPPPQAAPATSRLWVPGRDL
jgi:hypothetical protein